MSSPNLDNLSLHEEEEGGFCFDLDEEGEEQVDFRWCLVGRFLCDRPIHFNSMKVRLADVWKPVRGVAIKEAKSGLFLFHFNHALDMEGVLKGGPWTFDNNLLIVERVKIGMQIENIPLFHVEFWVQVHNLPVGLMKEKVGISLANFIGAFVEYDKNNNSSFWRQYMRIRVRVDVRQPLKKDTRVKNKGGEWCTVNFKYESDDGRRGWSRELRAELRGQGGRQSSRWLREEHVGGEFSGGGGRTVYEGLNVPNDVDPTNAEVAHNNQNIPRNTPNPNHHAIMTRQEQSLVIQNQSSNPTITDLTQNSHLSLPNYGSQLLQNSNNHPINSQTVQQHIPTPLLPNYHIVPTPSLPNNYHVPTTSKPIQNRPIIIHNIPFTSSGSHTSPTQPKINLMPCAEPINNLTQIEPIQNLNQTEPLTQTEPNMLVFSLNRVAPSVQNFTQNEEETTDMEIQTEKKRRREEEDQSRGGAECLAHHFLSAGPGRQDCRDQ